jgi:RNA polymerase sigma-70 factor (ECF subfamily)
MDSNAINLRIKASLKGDKHAFQWIVENYSDYVYRVAYRLVLNHDDAQDIAQESFLKIWKNLKYYKSSVKFTTWIYSIVTNLTIDMLRKEKLKSEYSAQKTQTEDGNSYSEQKNLGDEQLIDIIKKIAKDLPALQRICFVLKEIEGKSLKEVAIITNSGIDSVKSNLYHARKRIKELLKVYYKYEAK